MDVLNTSIPQYIEGDHHRVAYRRVQILGPPVACNLIPNQLLVVSEAIAERTAAAGPDTAAAREPD